MFDPNQFLDQQFTESNDSKITPVPVGEYAAAVESAKIVQWSKKDDPSVNGLKLALVWELHDENVKALLGRDKVTVKQDQMLDLNEGGQLDMGKGRNVGLGRLREALGMNTPGQPFAFSMLVGRMGKINVTHRVNGEDIFSEVKGVAKLA